MAIADPEAALRYAKVLADLYGDAAAQLIQTVARRLASGIDEPDWQMAKLLEIARLRDDTRAIVERLQVLGPEALERVVAESADDGGRAAARELGIRFGSTNTRAVEALTREAVGQVSGTHLRITRWTDDVFRAVINEVAAPDVVTGVASRRQAAQRALTRFARSGVTGFTDTAGRAWELESYVEMATRTASGRAMVEGRLEQYVEDGHDLVIVSDAPQECKLCRRWEGRVLSVRGLTSGYPTVRDATDAGLFHANCRHDLRRYVPGLTQRMTHTADPDGDKARQRQRALERRIRAAKRQVAAVEPFAASDPASKSELARAKGVLAKAQADMRAHVRAHDLKRQSAREQIGRAR